MDPCCVQYVPCACGNIVMSGHYATPKDNLYITTQKLLRIAKVAPSLFLVTNRCISISRLDKVSTRIISNSEVIIRCDVCRVGCKVLIPREDVAQALVVEYDELRVLQRRRMSAPNFSCPMSLLFPPCLKPFVSQVPQNSLPDSVDSPEKQRNDEEEDAIDQVDVDLLFSNEPDDDVVGGYVAPVFF